MTQSIPGAGLNYDKAIVNWLLMGCFLVIAMVIIGGITRLTGSGLSITQWKIVTGTLPPLSEHQWQLEFELYKQSSQYQLLNFGFTLADFKGIYWWEYLHRLLGRLIGLVFIVPFVWFWIKNRISKALMPRLLLILCLGAFQGFLGWYMVMSGLINSVSVSHFRLALHLLAAFITYGAILWVVLELISLRDADAPTAGIMVWVPVSLLIILMVQLMYGAFVAGLKAGNLFNTFPLMGDSFIPPGLGSMQPLSYDLSHNLSTVQFIHRLLGWLLWIYVTIIWVTCRKCDIAANVKHALNFLLGSVWLQFGLGIFTILNFVRQPVFWGVAHQLGAVLLLTAAIYFFFGVIYPKKKAASI